MKPRNVAKEIDSIISGIGDIIDPLQAAVATLKLAKVNLSKDPNGAATLAAVKEARTLIHQTVKKSGK